jgi:hypothetical protein
MEKQLDEQQTEFLRLAVVEQKSYGEIEKILGIERKVISLWWEELKEPREKLSAIRQVWQKKCNNLDKYEFIEWHEETEKKCYYCGLSEEENKQLWEKDSELTKRNRGHILEIDRKLPNEEYDNISNLVFSCYWCNNAKTDTFTEAEFKVIGKAIGEVWKDRLSE